MPMGARSLRMQANTLKTPRSPVEDTKQHSRLLYFFCATSPIGFVPDQLVEERALPSQKLARFQQVPDGCSIMGEHQQHGIASRKQNKQPHRRPMHTPPLLYPEPRTLRSVSQYQVHVASKMHGNSSSAQSLIAEGKVMGHPHPPPEISRTTKVTLWRVRVHPHYPQQNQLRHR